MTPTQEAEVDRRLTEAKALIHSIDPTVVVNRLLLHIIVQNVKFEALGERVRELEFRAGVRS